MSSDDARLQTDRSWLQGVQYRTDANLTARQSIYAWQRPRLNLPRWVLDMAGLHGSETLADVGTGNGAYLAELARRQHTGRMLGLDLSFGMLQAARGRALSATLITADAAALPLRTDSSDLTLAIHMLYHVPKPAAAVRELRRITRPGGQVLVVLNGNDHLRELRDLVTATLRTHSKQEPASQKRLRLDEGEALLASYFTSVTRHDFTSELLIPDPQPIEDYVRSMTTTQNLPAPQAFTTAVGRLVRNSGQIPFRIRTHSGCLICS